MPSPNSRIRSKRNAIASEGATSSTTGVRYRIRRFPALNSRRFPLPASRFDVPAIVATRGGVPARVETSVLPPMAWRPSPIRRDVCASRPRNSGSKGAKSGCRTGVRPAPCFTHYPSCPFILPNLSSSISCFLVFLWSSWRRIVRIFPDSTKARVRDGTLGTAACARSGGAFRLRRRPPGSWH
jgi:hypothetical protein